MDDTLGDTMALSLSDALGTAEDYGIVAAERATQLGRPHTQFATCLASLLGDLAGVDPDTREVAVDRYRATWTRDTMARHNGAPGQAVTPKSDVF